MKKIFIVVIAVVTAVFSCAFAQESIRLYGATTVADLLMPHKTLAENKLNYKLTIIGNTAGMGLIYLDEGKCDIALTATNLENTIAAAKIGNRDIKPEGFVVTELKNDELVFIVNSSNTVTTLTTTQLKKILSGWITNWNQLGGPDIPVVVISDKATGATRSLIKKNILVDTDFTPSTREFFQHDIIAWQVSITPGGIAGISEIFATPKVKILETKKLSRPLAFITKGKPEGRIKEVIDTFTDIISGEKDVSKMETSKPNEANEK